MLLKSRFVRIRELCERSGISRTTAWRWVRQGRLPPLRRLGPNTVGWLESEIEEWFAATASEKPNVAEESTSDGRGIS